MELLDSLEDEGMENEGLEFPDEDYLPRLDEMVGAMGFARRLHNADDLESGDYSDAHGETDQLIRDQQAVPERRYCYKCERWVSLGTGDEEGEDPRCTICTWQVCICGSCGCGHKGIPRSRS